jgi:hypothetical protein
LGGRMVRLALNESRSAASHEALKASIHDLALGSEHIW